jgi:hypothetical protein
VNSSKTGSLGTVFRNIRRVIAVIMLRKQLNVGFRPFTTKTP